MCAISSCLFLLNPSSAAWWIFCGCLLSISIPGAWVSLVGILAHWIPISRQGRIFSIFLSCFFLSDIISFIGVELVISTSFSGEIYIFLVACICFVFSIPAIVLLKYTPKKHCLLEPPTLQSSYSFAKPKSLKQIFLPLYKNTSFWLMALLALEIYGICHYFLIYSWQYILTCYCYPSGDTDEYSDCMDSNEGKFFAILISLCFPFCGIFSSIFVGILKDGISSKHRCVLLTTFSSAFLLFFMTMHYLLSISSLTMAVVFVCCCGLTILGPYSLLSGVFCVDVGGKYRSSTVSGIVNAFGLLFFLLNLEKNGQRIIFNMFA